MMDTDNRWHGPDEEHARKRAFERYGIVYDQEMKDEILAKIHRAERWHKKNNLRRGAQPRNRRGRDQEAFFKRRSHDSKIWNVILARGITVTVVYNRDRRFIVTFLPRDAGDTRYFRKDAAD